MKRLAVDRAIILAAGRGSRLGRDILGDGPKALLHVAGRSLLEWQVDALRQTGVQKILLVVGHGVSLVQRHAEALSRQYDVEFSFKVNTDFATTNTIVSMHLASSWLQWPCFCLNGDVLFPSSILQPLAHRAEPAALAIDVKLCGDEEVKVYAENGRVLAIGKHLDPTRSLGEFIGVACYYPEAGAHFQTALRHCVEAEGLKTAYFERGLDRIVEKVELSAVEFLGEPMIEIDTPIDLSRAINSVAPLLK